MYYTYVLRSTVDGKLYVGYTHNIEQRLQRHNAGEVFATRYRRPLTLLCYFSFLESETATSFEKFLKTGSGKAFLYNRCDIKKIKNLPALPSGA